MQTAMRGKWGAICALAVLGPGLLGTVHITPTVVLRKQAEVIRATLPDADRFFLRTVDVGRQDLERIRAAGYKLEDAKVKFYVGKKGDGLVGVVLFPQVNTQHGPLEAGLTFAPDGALRQVTITKATVETKPWIQRAISTGFLDALAGARTTDDAVPSLSKLRSSDPGKMPEFMGEVALRAVRQGLVLYGTLYAPSSG